MTIDAAFRAQVGPLAVRVRELLDYDEITGVFAWRVARPGTARVGVVAGASDGDGYWRIKVDGRRYRAHRLAWLWAHGTWPMGQIDHLDGNRLNNALANLRDVSHSVNAQNQREASRNNSSGLLGVSWAKNNGKWRAQIKAAGRVRVLGYFAVKEEAHARYVEAKREFHEGNTL